MGSRGNPDSPFMIVGESPGINELREGVPFVGVSGKVLFHTLPEGEDTDAYITNALLCHPRKKDQTILAKAVKACRPRLLADVARADRKIILALGNAAMWSLTGNYTLKITQDRGKLMPNNLASIGILPVIHPAGLLHGTGTYRQFRMDVLYATDMLQGKPQHAPIEPTWKIYDTKKKIDQLTKDILSYKGRYVVGDIETEGLNRYTHEILCIGIAVEPEHVYVIPADKLKYAKKLLEHPSKRWIWHSGKFDIAFLRREGINARVDEDTLLLSYALDESTGVHDLEQVAGDLLDAPNYKAMLKPWLPKKSTPYSEVPPEVLYEYLAKDVSLTLQIFNVYRPRVASNEADERNYTRTLIPSSELYYHVENKGFLVDKEWLSRKDRELLNDVEKAAKIIENIAKHPINPNSPQQMAEFLFDKLRLPRRRGRSTNKEVLDKLPPHPAVKALKAFRKASKAHSTYIKGVERAIQDDGRVHQTVKIHGTRTGRPSSTEPNMFNIPRDPEIRGMFIAALGYILLEFDLNQAELRSLAGLSNDEYLCDLYNSTDRSLHNEVAAEFFGPDYTPEDKMRAKAVNFGIVYGRTAASLAEEFENPVRESQRYIDQWFAKMPGAHEYIQKCRMAPGRLQTIVTTFGRKKRHYLVTRANLKDLANEASNFPHQSIASDINLHAAILVRRPLAHLYNAHIVNLVYDSIIVECLNKPEIIKPVKELVISTMESIAPEWGITRVPFTAECKEGVRWGHLE